MTLASPLPPAHTIFTSTADESTLHIRPALTREAFNSLLPPPVEFVEGSSSGALAVPPGKYHPINASPKSTKPELPDAPKQPAPTPVKHSNSTPQSRNTSLYPHGIDTTWPQTYNRGSGLYNSGNTCFLNSTLQCLVHTPPLLQILIDHTRDTCRVEGGFCMSCGMHLVISKSYGQKNPFPPSAITSKLQVIAKHMRRGRQEDSHEFLRYAIDALQKSCLAGYPSKIDPKLAETTWVHKVFGGRLRSRVTCGDCGYNSDTFDRILDLSVDIRRSEALKDALRTFVAVDCLKGADKYKCEKCKKPVNAEKRFTVHDAPLVLTVHLKRFSPTGKKIGHYVQYDERLSLGPYMSEGQLGPSYSLYGVVCHAGGGPNSGHYYAFVKSRDGSWWEMNDESVTKTRGPPLDKRNAYMLFYLREKGQDLKAAINGMAPRPKSTLAGSMKKRKVSEPKSEAKENGEDTGTKVTTPFIGPLRPSPMQSTHSPSPKRQKLNGVDPQAALLKDKIAAVDCPPRNGNVLGALAAYGSDDEQASSEGNRDDKKPAPLLPSQQEASSPPVPTPSSDAVPPELFYDTPNPKKRKALDNHFSTPLQYRSTGYTSSFNPYNHNRMTNRKKTRPI